MSHEDLGPIASAFRRHIGFADNAGVKDAKGKPINLTLHQGRMLSPCQPEFYELSKRVELRPDDVILSGYIKTGSHWMFEAITMIIKGQAEFSQVGKGISYLEFASPELYTDLPSPRLLNTLNRFDWLPEKVRTYKNKIIVTVRNPKDVAVSLYHHHIFLKEMYNYSGDFQDWFPLYRSGRLDCGDYFEYYLDWEKVIRDNPDHPILVVKYEDCVQDLPGIIRTIAKFLGHSLNDGQVQQIANTLSFQSLKKHFQNTLTEKLIRKGVVGDWKNWLTEGQSAELDRLCGQLKGTHFEPKL